ncbi:MAG: hypothetical protein R2761_22380 [Acidimicrobiales bacterium]
MSDYPSDWGNQPPQNFPPQNVPPGPANQPPPQSYPPPGPTPAPPPAPEPGYGAPPPATPGPYAPQPGSPYGPQPGSPYGPQPGDPYGAPAAPQPSPYGVPPGSPPPGFGPPPQAPSGPPPRTRTRPRVWPWLLGFLGLFMLLIGGCSYWVYSLAKGPIDAVNSYVAALDEGRYDDAYDGLCTTTRQTVSLQQFQADNSAAPRISGYTFASVAAATGQLTRVEGTVDIDGSPVAATYGLQRENGDWKICEYFPLQ